MKYRVVGKTEPVEIMDSYYSPYLEDAQEIKDTYGLDNNLNDIINIWKDYSENFYCAGWINPDKDDIEKAFGVILEEIE